MATKSNAGWLLGLAGLWSAMATAGTPLPDGPHIVVNGEARVSVKPDTVRVSFEFTSKAAQPLSAKKTVDDNVNRVLNELAAFDIADDDVEAGSLSLSEDVQYSDSGRRVSNGHKANRTVEVTLRRIDRFNDLLDAGLSAGAQEIGYVEFESSRAEQLRLDAKRQAAENARSKAEQNARAFGAMLGSIYSIDSIQSVNTDRYAGNTLDTVTVTGGRLQQARYLQPMIDYRESVQAVFELER